MKSRLVVRATLRADLAAICARLQPATIGCFNLAEVSLVPLDVFVRGGSRVWFVDGEAGRVERLLADEIVREQDGRRACLACDAALDGHDVCAAHGEHPGASCESHEAARTAGHCAHFVPGRRLRVINGDGGRGRGAGFATRIEGVVASARTVLDALDGALAVCHRSAQMNVPLPLEDGSLDLAISVLAPSRLLEQPYAYFEELMTRRFGAWTESARSKALRRLGEVQDVLFRTQLDAHVIELARLVRPHHGRLYFAMVPATPVASGAWSLERGVAECIEAVARSFEFDFDGFPAEAFLRRPSDDRSVVIQAALLRLRTSDGVVP